MKKFAKISAVLAAMALAFSFAGCSDGSSGGGSDSSEITGGGTSGGGNETIPEGFVKVKGGTVEGKENNYDGVFIDGRTVTLSDFYMSKFEVTQDEYSEVMTGLKVTVSGTECELNANPSYCTEKNSNYTVNFGTEQGKRPVEFVTWYDAVYYCNARSEKEGLTPAYGIAVMEVSSDGGIKDAVVTWKAGADGYRLPTEADWDYTFSSAATADITKWNSNRNSGLDAVGWYACNNDTGTTVSSVVTIDPSGRGTHQVGQKAPNALGIYDMSGNVWEWCYDWYDTVNTGNETDPAGASSGSKRCLRGGSWYHVAYYCEVVYRGGQQQSWRPRRQYRLPCCVFRAVSLFCESLLGCYIKKEMPEHWVVSVVANSRRKIVKLRRLFFFALILPIKTSFGFAYKFFTIAASFCVQPMVS